MSVIQSAAILASLVASVAAHGHVQGIVAGGTYYTGYDPSFQYSPIPPIVIGWSDPQDLDNGFIAPSNYTNPDIICHRNATAAGTSARIAAGDVVEPQWTPWPSSHHGPVIDYLAKCPGSCSDVDKTTLEFFKIDQVGLIDDTTEPGTWGSDQLLANNNSWTVTIPPSIAPGNYVLRHEIIALHSAGTADGAQNYPQCVNLEITGSGTDTPAGTLGQKLYGANDSGILINIYQSLSTYEIPGPSLYSGAVAMSQTQVAITGYAPLSSGGVAVSIAYSSATTTTAAAGSSSVARSTTAASASASTAIVSALPSTALTQTLPTVLPTGTAVSSNDTIAGLPPAEAPPAGTTLQDLFAWLEYMLEGLASTGGRHQRDFKERK
ncbi:glycoside hydrolase family 61 protein [Baudoinia panamericana UAMH 10762]|uniref:Glycoside hydrolase family 61 protein n=1 Tax=Baudoinia panamericana (strain UAMH 10762) TaxID=717646 RepID=M2NBE1_BAUPA|nr:glycoside hydrolase family 61 protein [Baudoinia panamericana UAMH 10762]EMC96205.1 glycoside hydrolase family 61 protein [Baudoinia panamericana UAMH 10762]